MLILKEINKIEDTNSCISKIAKAQNGYNI